ncbi:rotatin isoform X2 [Pseudophryne corroboree]|uniref:rotatin isoform X2 n=1 Tax=Pseudophryne corroboree TaxID=495146 RepID=UPI0030817DAB
MDLPSLVKKLGHHLIEIRERALKNIICKLDHNLLTLEDLVQEKSLFLCLLEWFNFPTVPMKKEVLQLLNKLHSLAAQWLIDMGAVDFFSQLRPNIEPNLQVIVDDILDGLFLLPTEMPCNPVTSPDIVSWPVQDYLAIQQQEEIAVGYFQPDTLRLQPPQTHPEETKGHGSKATCLKFSTFPWLTLTTTDKHVLSSNECSLKSKNHSLIWRSCQLLQDVVMEDFPAEIFLQRPKIVKSLLSLLGLASEKDGQRYLAFQSASCLYHLCTQLRSSLNFHRDPGFLSTKQEAISQNSSVSYYTPATRNSQNPSPEIEHLRPSVVGRTSQRLSGDGQDLDATPSSGNSIQAHANPRTSHWSPLDRGNLDPPEVENEDTLDLQFQQLSLPQFCVLVLESAAPLLKSERQKPVMLILELLREDLLLLGDAISENVWEDASLIGQELRCKLLLVLDTLGEAILYHKNNNSSEKPDSSLVNHRMAFISISLFTMRLLQTLLPVEKASDVLPESLMNALFLISLDLPFRIAYPSVHESVIAFMEQLNSEDYGVYKQTLETVYSIECAASFMSCSSKEGPNFLELVELTEKSLVSLPYHKHFQLIGKFIRICSDIYNSAQSGPVLLEESQKVLLRLMSHWMPAVRSETYKYSLDIVKDSLGIHNVTKPVSTICHGINFLLQPRVLYEICTFGLQDPNSEISSAAKAIVTFLLQGRLVMTALSWNKFIEALYPVLPVLQGFADTEEALGTAILTLCETSEGGKGALPKTTLLKAALRFLYAKKLTLRSLGIKWLLVHLMNDKKSNCKRPELQGSIMSKAVSLYITERPLELKLDNKGISFFKAETVKKVAEIFTSENVDIALRKSAAEQLAVITQDMTMHSVVQELGIVEKIRNILQNCVHQDGKAFECLILPCLTLLRKLLYANSVLRLSLAQDPNFLITLFRVSLLLQTDGALLVESGAVICLLLFDEISRMDTWSESTSSSSPPFSLPVTVVRQFHLPVSVSTHHAVSPYTMSSPLSSEWITVKPVSDMLRMAWNLSWYQGIDNFLSNPEKEPENFLGTLKLSPVEVLTLKMTHSASGLQDCLSYIIQAVSHGEVRSAVARMNFYLLNDGLVLNCLTDYNMSSLKCLPWHTALSRFLLVQPACTEDEKLLADVISFLNKILREQSRSSDTQDLQWILDMLFKQSPSPLLDLIVQKEQTAKKDLDDTQAAVRQHLQKELMVFFNTLMLCLASVTDRKCLILAGSFRTQLAQQLLHCLKVSDAPHFYGLPSLARTLRGMVHVTSLPGWSSHCPLTEPMTTCVKLLTSLLEIISSFYVEWGGNALSYMGKGVTKSTVLCLLHLSHEMTAQARNTDWVHLWSLPYDQGSEEQVMPRLGLEWLIPLWVDRDPEVRFTSLGIGSALTSIKEGCVILCDSCQNISGGLCGTVLSIFLDQYECSMVRREAAFILQNMLVIPMPDNSEDSRESNFQILSILDEETGLPLAGKPALEALLRHYHFYEHVSHMAKNCYLGRYIFDLDNSTVASKTMQDDINCSEDSLYIWNSTTSVSSTSGSESTLSTIISNGSYSANSSEYLVPVSASPVSENVSDQRLDQGQSNKARTASLSSEEICVSVSMPDQCSLVTPSLLSAVCGLLENLLVINPDGTVNALSTNHLLTDLASLIKPAVLERCFSDLKTSLTPEGRAGNLKSQVLALLQYLSSLSRFLQSCLLVNTSLLIEQELIRQLLATLSSLLFIHHKKTSDVKLKTALYQSWTDVFMLLTSLLRQNGPVVIFHITATLTKHGNSFFDTISECVALAANHPSLYAACLYFLSALLAEEGNPQLHESQSSTTLSFILDGNLKMGNSLCKIILQSYDEKSSEDPLKQACASALISLLAVSSSAQMYSLQAYFIDSCAEKLKYIHAQLTLESLRTGKSTQRKKEDNLFKQLKVTLHLLRNCIYKNEECKTAALESQFASVLHSLWPWLLMDDTLMQGALQLLCVYTANFPAACSSLCWTNTTVTTSQPSQKSQMNNSLLHSVLKIAAEPVSSGTNTQQVAFGLLSNLVGTQDCKCIIQKSNFLQNFLSLSLPKGGNKNLGVMANLWLTFLWNLSLGNDGQLMIMKLKGSLDLLLEITKYKQKCKFPMVLLILHNICFNPANKPKILSNDNIVALFCACLENNNINTQRIGVSALWALLHNYQKAKVTLKTPLLKGRVEEALSTMRKCKHKDGFGVEERLEVYHLKCLENLDQLLSN